MKKSDLITNGIAIMLSCILLSSCNNEDLFEKNQSENTCDEICFGVSTSNNQKSRGNDNAGVNEYTSDRFVLRSNDSADTLCVRTIISDNINSSTFDANKAVTRGTPITGDNFTEFKVLTYWKKNREVVNDNFFMNEVVTKGNGDIWNCEHTYYWPGKDYTLQFCAWAPTNVFSSIPTTQGTKKFEYTVPDLVTEQQDILVANSGEVSGNLKEAQQLDFKHICTAVRFVTGAQMQPGTIKSVSLVGVYYQGTYDMSAPKWNLNNKEVKTFTQELNKEMAGTESDGSEITLLAGTFMMLPQTLPANAKIQVIFQDNTTSKERILEAPIAGTEWPQGKTVTYKLSITPEYELEFISGPELQDAHYVIYPIHIKAKDVPEGSWTMTSSDAANVTLRTELTTLTNRGYWIEEDKGSNTITGTTTGDDIIVYAFLTENVTEETRKVELQLRPTNMPDATPATFTISQLCPSWNGDLGCERIEDGDYPWGFLWPKGMKIKYNMENAGLGDWIKNTLLNAYLEWFTDYSQFIIKETIPWTFIIKSVTIDYDAVPQVAVAKDENNGLKNTLELYNFNGINDVSTLEDILNNWGGVPDGELPLNPEEFAARSCSMKNKYHKEIEQQGGQTIEIPVLPQNEVVWYLPAKNEAPLMKDEAYPLQGGYWTSTNSLDEHDNENAFKYTAGGITQLERRDTYLHYRAVRKKP